MDDKKNATLSYYIKLIRKWRVFIVIHLISVALVAVALSLIIPKTYTSRATILPSGGSGMINTILPPQMTEGLGGTISRLTGSSSDESNKLLSILNSRNLAESVIEEFNLMEQFEAPTIEDAIENYRQMASVGINDELMLELTVRAKADFFNVQESVDQARHLTFNIANFILNELDENFTKLNVEKATFERRLLQERFEQNQIDIIQVEEQLLEFAETHSMIDLPSQIQAAIETAANLESQILVNEIELQVLQQTFSERSSEIKQKEIIINESKKRLNELKLNSTTESENSLFPSLENSPNLILEYARLQREQQVQSSIYEFLFQQLEQVKLEEAKQTPTLQFIDVPALPTKRSAPVRSIFVIILCLIGTTVGAAYILIHELYTNKYREVIISSWNGDDD